MQRVAASATCARTILRLLDEERELRNSVDATVHTHQDLTRPTKQQRYAHLVQAGAGVASWCERVLLFLELQQRNVHRSALPVRDMSIAHTRPPGSHLKGNIQPQVTVVRGANLRQQRAEQVHAPLM